MSRARITLRKRRHDGIWHAYYRAHDDKGRLIFQDDGTASIHWTGFMRRAEEEVGALRVIGQYGYRTDKDWNQLVEEADA